MTNKSLAIKCNDKNCKWVNFGVYGHRHNMDSVEALLKPTPKTKLSDYVDFSKIEPPKKPKKKEWKLGKIKKVIFEFEGRISSIEGEDAEEFYKAMEYVTSHVLHLPTSNDYPQFIWKAENK